MANFKVQGNTVIRVDASAGGGLSVITQYVDTISGNVAPSYMSLDVTHFDDLAEAIIPGIEEGGEFQISGAFDDTATTGPDAIFSTAVGTILTFEFNPVGTAAGARKYTMEAMVLSYQPSAEVKGRVNYETRFKKTGQVTIGTNT